MQLATIKNITCKSNSLPTCEAEKKGADFGAQVASDARLLGGQTKAAGEIPPAEDRKKEIKFTLHPLRGKNLKSQIRVARNGEEALEFLA